MKEKVIKEYDENTIAVKLLENGVYYEVVGKYKNMHLSQTFMKKNKSVDDAIKCYKETIELFNKYYQKEG